MRFIACSVLDYTWLDALPHEPGHRFLFVAEGLFMYLPPEGVRSLVTTLVERFAGSELVAEVASRRSVRLLNSWLGRGKFKREFGLSENVVYAFGVEDSREFEGWAPGIEFLDRWTYFDEDEPKLGWYRMFASWPLFRWPSGRFVTASGPQVSQRSNKGIQQTVRPCEVFSARKLRGGVLQLIPNTFGALGDRDGGAGMATVVSLARVVDELDALMDECTAYLNRQTGELYALQDEEAGLIEDGADPEDLPEWLWDEIPKVREVLESEDWLPLPTKFDIHEWAIMDGFARSIDDPGLRDELLGAIRGRGAFRYFKDTVHRRGIQEDWYGFRTAALERIAADWLDEHGISYTHDEDPDAAEDGSPAG